MVCIIFWFLLGILLGLLLFWLIDKLFRRTGERELEKCRTECDRLKAQLLDANTVAAKARVEAEKQSSEPAAMSASAFGYKSQEKGRDNLKVVEGIGPKIEQLLIDAGIETFKQLSTKQETELLAILEAAGPRFKLARPKSWPVQAELCANQEWAKLKEYQDYLDGGVDLAERASD